MPLFCRSLVPLWAVLSLDGLTLARDPVPLHFHCSRHGRSWHSRYSVLSRWSRPRPPSKNPGHNGTDAGSSRLAGTHHNVISHFCGTYCGEDAPSGQRGFDCLFVFGAAKRRLYNSFTSFNLL
ncbi:hypothetical protein V8F33_011981 [Rhypophila sp. PSN 637]